MASRGRRLTRAEHQAQTRAALVDAAARVFVQRGFQGATVDAITEEAGYSRGAFYSNFQTKEELLAEVLQQRVFAVYRDMARRTAARRPEASAEDVGTQLAALQEGPDARWLFPLWLELMAHAARDEEFRQVTAGFWSGTRELVAPLVERAYEERGVEPPASPRDLASAMIALDIGLSVQHLVDPEAVSTDVWPQVWRALFGA